MVGYSVKEEASNQLITTDSQKRPDLLIHDHSPDSNTLVDFITCVVSKSTNVTRAASLPGVAADNSAHEKHTA